MLQFAVRTLEQLETVWPLATRWRVTLTHLIFSSSTHDSLNETTTGAVTDEGQSSESSKSRGRLSADTTAVGSDNTTVFSAGLVGSEPCSAVIDEGLNSMLFEASEPSMIDCGPFGADLTAFLRGEPAGWQLGVEADGSAPLDAFDVFDLFPETF